MVVKKFFGIDIFMNILIMALKFLNQITALLVKLYSKVVQFTKENILLLITDNNLLINGLLTEL